MMHVLVFGLARSGTTLVANLLNSQPHCTVYRDFLAAPLFAAREVGGFAKPLSRRLHNRAVAQIAIELPGFNCAAPSLREIYQAALLAIGKPEDTHVGHKVTGSISLALPVLEDTDVRVIYVLRDIRDVVLSQWEFGWDNTDATIERWRQSVAHLPVLEKHPRAVALRFEELVRKPQAALSAVERLLGMPIDTSLNALRERGAAPTWFDNSAFHDVNRLFDVRAVERWREHRDTKLVRYASWRCRRELAACGYDTASPHLKPRQRLTFAARALMLGAAGRASNLRCTLRSKLLPSITS